jgi:hypothetical protein
VDILRNKTERSILGKIRLSAHNLAIERGSKLLLILLMNYYSYKILAFDSQINVFL